MTSNSEIAQKSFNPSWMQASPLKMPKPNGTHRVSNEEEDNSASLEMMEPIFAKHRYGREDILALIPKDSKGPPDGLSRCPYFLEKPLTPIILTNLNETEQRIQHNINSSKALSAAHRTEWPSKENNDVSGSNSPQAANPWTIAGSSRTASSFRSGNNRWTAPNNSEGARTQKTNPGFFARQGFAGAGGNNPEKSRLAKTPWAEANSGNGFRTRQHLKSGGEESRAEETEQPKVPSSDAWDRGGWRTSENKNNDRQKAGELHSKTTTPFARAPNADNLKSEQTKESIWSSSALHNNSVWTPPSSLQNSVNEPEKSVSNIAHSSSSSLERQKSVDIEMNSQRSKISPTRINPTEFLETKPDQWFYLDPQNIQRGPFTGEQMQAWFLNGYFQHDLNIMQPGDNSYTPLGDLIKLNGALTPFYNVKTQNVSPSNSSSNASANMPWASKTSAINRAPVQDESKNRNAELSLESLKLFEAKERMIVEEQRKLREKEEALRREEREREEKNAALLEMQMQLERQRQEIEKRAREQERQAELHRIQILEYEQQQRQKLEKIQQEEMLRHQQEELLRRRQAEAQKKEEERLLLAQVELKQKEARRHQELLEIQRQQELKKQQEAEKLAAITRMREQEQLAAYECQQKLVQEQQLFAAQQKAVALAASKAAPWSSSANQQNSKGTEFRKIQEQERMESLTRKMLEDEKRKESEAEQKRIASSAQNNGNPWNVVKSTTKPVPIPPAKENQSQQPKAAKTPAAKAPKQQPIKETKVEDPLTSWIIQSIKKISTSVDPEVFAAFLLEIESPNEVEDYVLTYFGETKKAKEFHQEFLAKRIELRPRSVKKVDDLSAPARSATDIPSSSGAKGKKAKKGKKVDISNMLNFRPAGDSTRLNVGEIDIDFPAPLKKGKKK